MGKSFKGFSKALSLILAVAMVVTCVPTSAYAADLFAGESEDLLISNDNVAEEVSDALVTDDALASDEDDSSLSIDTQVEADLVSAPDENTAGEEENVEPDQAVGTRALYIVDNTDTVPAQNFTYGTPFTPVKIKAQARAKGAASASDYAGGKFTLMVLKDITPTMTQTQMDAVAAAYTNGSNKPWDDYKTAYDAWAADQDNATLRTALNEKTEAVEALLSVDDGSLTAAEEGITVTDGGNGVFTIAPSTFPKKVLSRYYVLKLEDKAEDNPSEANPVAYSKPFTFKVNSVAVGADLTRGELKETGADDGVIEKDDASDPDYRFVFNRNCADADIAVGSNNTAIKMNYTVYDKFADIPTSPAPTNDSVVAAKVKLTVPAAINDTTGSQITDLTATITDAVGDGGHVLTSFVAVPDETVLDIEHPVTYTVKPAANLAVKDNAALANNGYQGKYVAYLHIRSKKAMTADLVYKLVFVITNDITFTATEGTSKVDIINKQRTDESDPAIGTVYNKPVVLTSKKFGDRFEDIVITAKGGSGGLKIMQIADPANNDTPVYDGVDFLTSTSADGKTATLTISGAIEQQDPSPASLFLLQAKDDDENESEIWFQLSAVDTDKVEIKLNDTKMTYGNGAGSSAADQTFTWKAAKDATTIEKAATVTLTNKSAVNLKIKPTIASTTHQGTSCNTGSISFEPASVADGIDVPAGESVTFKVVPGANDSAAKKALVFKTADPDNFGITETDVILDFAKLGTNIDISSPAADKDALTDGKKGKAYSYTFKATKAGNVGDNLTWSILSAVSEADASVQTTLTSTLGTMDPSTLTTAAQLKAKGLELSEAGVLSGTPKAKEKYSILVECAYTEGGSAAVKHVYRLATLDVKANGDEVISLKSGATALYEVGQTSNKTLALPDLRTDSTKAATSYVDVKNILNLAATDKITKVSISLGTGEKLKADGTAYEALPGGTNSSDLLEFKYSDIDSENATIAGAGGYEIKTGETKTFTLASKIPSAAGSKLVAGDYKIPVSVTVHTDNTDLGGTYTFDVTMHVVNAPIITAKANTTDTNKVNTGVTLKKTDAVGFDATIAGSTPEFKFTWTDAVDKTNTSPVSGLTLNEDGFITGKAAKAGDYKVLVTAESRTDATVTSTLEYTLKVGGSATLGITATTGPTAIGENKVWVLPGLVKGSTTPSAVELRLVPTSADATVTAATNLKVTIEDAEDDRTSAAEIAKNPENPYKDNKNYFEADKPTIPSATKDLTTLLTISTKGNPDVGEYKAKVTITGDNITTRTFYVYLVVVNKFELNLEATASAEVGVTFNKEFGAIGGVKDQYVKFSEVAPEEKNPLTNAKTNIPTGLTLTPASTPAQIVKPEVGVKGNLGGGSASKTGTYTIKIKAMATNGAADTNPTPTAFVSTSHKDSADYLNKNTGIPAQTDEKTITLTVGKISSDNFKITAVTGGDNTKTEKINDVVTTTDIGMDADPVGNGWTNYRGYTYKTRGLSDATLTTLTVEVTNGATLGVYNSIALGKGTESPFTLTHAYTAGTGDNKGKYLFPAGATTFTIAPKATTTAGTYTDTVTISGDQMETPVTFSVTFTKAEDSFEGNVAYSEDATLDDKDVVLAEKNVVKGSITLDSFVTSTGTPTTSKNIFFKNVGNCKITNVQAEESDASGNVISSLAARRININNWTTGGTAKIDMAAGATEDYFTIEAKQGDAEEVSTYLKLSFRKGDTTATESIVIPVYYVITAKDLASTTISPSDTVELATQAEGYVKTAATGGDFTITNANPAGEQNALTGVDITLSNSEFEFVVTDSKAKETGSKQRITVDSLAAGNGTVGFRVLPKAGLAVGPHTATITVAAANLKKNITGTVKFVVTESDNFVTDIYNSTYFADTTAVTAVGVTNTLDVNFAQRLYDSLAVGTYDVSKSTKSTNAAVRDISGSGPVVVLLDLDGDNNGDAKLSFTGPTTPGTHATVTSATMEIDVTADTDGVTAKTKTIYLSPAEKTKAAGAGPTYNKYFESMTFNPKSVVGFTVTAGPTGTKVVKEKQADLKAENVIITGSNFGKDNETITGIYAVVPNTDVVTSVFKDGKLPTTKDTTAPTKSFQYWKTSGNAKVGSNTEVLLDAVGASLYDVVYHTHTYSRSINGTAPGVAYKWTGNATTGYTDVEVTLTCVDPDCTDENKGTVTFYTKGGNTLKENVQVALTKGEKPADCEHGKGMAFTATLNYGGKTYKDFKYTDEDTSTIKGHTYVTTIKWEKQTDGSYKPVVEQQCSVCDSTFARYKFTATTVNVDTEVKKAATCTKDGETVYTITSFVDGNGKTVTGSDLKAIANYTYTATIEKKGHAEEPTIDLDNVVVADDQKSATADVKITCPVCNEVLYEAKGLTLTLDAEGNFSTKVKSPVTEKEYTVTYVNHVHKWVATWAEWTRTDATDKFSWSTELTLTCTEGGKPEVKKPKVTVSKTVDDKYIDYKATAEYDKQTYESEVWTVDAETGEPTAKHEHKWGAPKWTWTDATTVSAEFTCSVGKETKTVAGITKLVKTDKKGNTLYEATVTGPDGKTYTSKQAFDKDGKKTSLAPDSGDTESEPENSNSYNLFYTDEDINISLPSGTTYVKFDTSGNLVGSGKWTSFFKVDSTGKVTVTASDRKKAANAANSLIVAPVYGTDDDGNEVEIGDFEYQLPVSYQKPSLKLTSTKGTIKKGLEGQKAVTKVTEKKSSGVYEALDISEQDTETTPYYAAKNGTVTSEAGDNPGEIVINTTDKASGKIQVKLPDWNEKVELSYSISAVTKDILTASAKQVIINANAKNKETQSFRVELNGNEISSESDGVKVDAKSLEKFKKSGLEISSGIDSEGCVVDSDITVSFGSGTPVKGSYSLKFTKDKVNVTVKVVVSNVDLDKAVKLTVKSKLNAVTGQKMVVVPTLSAIGGPIESVDFESSEDTYEADWDAERGTIIIGVQDGKTVKAGKFEKKLVINAGGEECKVTLSTQIIKSNPTVKVGKVVIPKSKLINATGEGTANVVSTYKLGGKTFKINPEKVVFMVDNKTVAPADEDLGEGWFKIEKANVSVKYNEDGTIDVKALKNNSKGKGGSVKVWFTFGEVTVKKTLTVKAGKN